ncbi:MAG: flexitail domain-containing putative surface protein, partial [bacterium]
HYDYMNPSHDGQNRVDDILMVVNQYHHNDPDSTPGFPPYTAGYNPDTDRTALIGGNTWSLGPPDGQQTVADILAEVKQYHHDCS